MRRTKFWGDFEIETDRLILARRSNLQIVNKKENLAVPAYSRVKLKESEKRDKYLDLARELKKKYGS